MSKPINYIMHIPKTAGMSLQALVRRRHKNPGSLALFYSLQTIKEGFKDTPTLSTVMGHYRFGFHKFSTRPANYFTFLRNPIDQVISNYNYTKDHADKYENLPEKIGDLCTFARSEYGYNLQTRFVSGINNLAKFGGQEALEIAKENLQKHFKFVGITEEFDLSMLLLGQQMGWKIVYYENKNRGVQRKKVDPPTKDELTTLKDILQYDIALYEFGKTLFQKQKENNPEMVAYVPRFQRNNARFQKLNPYYIKLKKLLGLINPDV